MSAIPSRRAASEAGRFAAAFRHRRTTFHHPADHLSELSNSDEVVATKLSYRWLAQDSKPPPGRRACPSGSAAMADGRFPLSGHILYCVSARDLIAVAFL
ncbi:hypothetical protein [Nonomuraea sp. NPDC003709]|uniref:hypothetical protein n=1 Tax=Nonomuraea sp. NPDC003709 TaxID=3154450 RepID=UPI0033AFF220